MSKDDRLAYSASILRRLPPINLGVLRYLLSFLARVTDRSCLNKMTCSNLAVVFGPNLACSRDQALSLANIGPINAFTEFVLTNQEEIFEAVDR